MLLDIFTVVFLVAGLALVWLNLRQWRRRKVKITPDDPRRLPKGFEPDAK
jgi:hypothetical protein